MHLVRCPIPGCFPKPIGEGASTLEVNGITRTFQFFQIKYPKIALTLSNFIELHFFSGCNGEDVILIFV